MESLFNLGHMLGWQLIPILSLFITAAYTDMKDYKIYNWNTSLLAGFNFLYFVVHPVLLGEYKNSLIHLAGGIVSFIILLSVGMFFMVKMGGDIKFAGGAGLAFGGIQAVMWLLISIIIGGLHGLFKIKFKKESKDNKLPFAPYFLLGAIVQIMIYLLLLYYGGVV